MKSSLVFVFVWFCTLSTLVSSYAFITSPFVLDIVSPSSIAGFANLVPTSSSFSLNGYLANTPLIMLNSKDDSTGCKVPVYNFGDSGINFTSSIIITPVGKCPYSTQYKNIAALKPIGWLSSFEANAVLSFVSSGTPPIQGLVDRMWFYELTYLDAQILMNYLLFNVTNNVIRVNMLGAAPIDPTERAQLLNVTTVLLNSGYDDDCTLLGCGNLLTMSQWVADPSIDPCLNRLMGTMCFSDSQGVGHIVGLIFRFGIDSDNFNWNWLPSFPNLAGIILTDSPKMRGAIPESFCNMPDVAIVLIVSNNSITSFPDCFLQSNLNDLFYIDVRSNQLTSLPPSLTSKTFLAVLLASNNFLTSFHIHNPFIQYVLIQLDLTNNLISQPLVDFSNFISLSVLKLGFNQFTNDGFSIETYFNNLPALTILDVSHNLLSGPLPNLINTVQLIELSLDGNGFYGDLPISWSKLFLMTSLSVSHNLLNGSISTLTNLNALSSLDISYNQLSIYSSNIFLSEGSDVGQYFSISLPSSLVLLDASHNNFEGIWNSVSNPKWPLFASNLQTLVLSYNAITMFATNLCNGFLTTIYLDHNNLQGSFPICTLSGNMLLINVEGNPSFHGPMLPEFAHQNLDTLLADAGTNYLCPKLEDSSNSLFSLVMSPSYYDYLNCECNPGLYGLPPNCKYIPDEVLVNTSLSRVRDATLLPLFNVSNNLVSDMDYGNARLMTGMTSVFVVQSNDSLVRVTNLLIYINLDAFIHATDIIEVFQGFESDGVLVFSILGTSTADLLIGKTLDSNLAATLGYNNVGVFFVQVTRSVASVRYSSRQTNGSLFSMDNFFSYDCPENYYLSNSTNECMLIGNCTSSDYSVSVSSCDTRTLTQTVTFTAQLNLNCYVNTPRPEHIACTDVPDRNTLIAILGAVSGLFLILLLVPIISSQCGSEIITFCGKNKQYKVVLLNALDGVWSSFLILSWVLQLATVFVNISVPTEFTCNFRLYGILISFAAGQGSLFVSARFISSALSNQILNLQRFSIRATVLLTLGIVGEIIILAIMTTTTSGSLISSVIIELSEGSQLETQVCSLGEALGFATALLVLNMTMSLITIVQILPNWLAWKKPVSDNLPHWKQEMKLIQQEMQFWQMLSLSLVSGISLLTTIFLVVFTYTNAAGILQNNYWITVTQMILFLFNVFASSGLYYCLPWFGSRGKQRQQHIASTNELEISLQQFLTLKSRIALNDLHPMIQVLNEPLARSMLIDYLNHNVPTRQDLLKQAQFLDDFLDIFANLKPSSDMQNIVLYSNNGNVNNVQDEKNDTNAIPGISTWLQQLAQLLDNNTTLFQKNILNKFTRAVTTNPILSRSELRALLKPLILPIYKNVEVECWKGFSISKQLNLSNQIFAWESFYRQQPFSERKLILKSLETQFIE